MSRDKDLKQHRRWIGVIEITLAGFGFGFLGIFGKLAYQNGLSIGELLTFRFLLAAGLMAGLMSLFSPKLLRISRRQLLICAGLGVLGYAVFASLYFKAIEGVSVSLASLLLYTYPVLVTLGAYFFLKEPVSRRQWLALPVTAGGLFILLNGDTQIHSWVAVAAGLMSALCYTLYILFSSRYQADIHPLTSGLYVMLFAGLGLFVIHGPNPMRAFSLSNTQSLIIFGIALVSTVLPLTLFLSGLQKLGNTQASLLSSIEPITAATLAALIFGERLSSLQWLGGALILVGLFLTVWWQPSRPSPHLEHQEPTSPKASEKGAAL